MGGQHACGSPKKNRPAGGTGEGGGEGIYSFPFFPGKGRTREKKHKTIKKDYALIRQEPEIRRR